MELGDVAFGKDLEGESDLCGGASAPLGPLTLALSPEDGGEGTSGRKAQ